MPGAPITFHIPSKRLSQKTIDRPLRDLIVKYRMFILLACAVFFGAFYYSYFATHKIDKFVSLPSPLPEFVGRKKAMRDVQKALTKKNTTQLPIAILWGEGGIGKTETAIQFANTHLNDYSLVYWINASSKEVYQQSYYELANHFDIPIGQRMPFDKIREKVHQILESQHFNKPWLLIYDNAEEIFDLPKRGNGNVLITTRNRGLWKSHELIELFPLSPQSSAELFAKMFPKESMQDWNELAKQLDFFPLALNQAAHYIKESPNFSLSNYKAMVEENSGSVYKYSTNHARYAKNLALMWEMSIEQLRTSSPESCEWLEVCSQLHPDKIPIEWLELWLIQEKGIDTSLAKLEANEILRILLNQGYFRVDKDNQSLTIHRLKQNLIKSHLEYPDLISKKTITFLTNLVQSFIFHDQLEWSEDAWNQLLNWESNATWWLSKNSDHHLYPKEIATILNVLGNFNVVFKGRYPEGREYYQQALTFLAGQKFCREGVYTYLNRSFCFFRLGMFELAQQSAKKALECAEKKDPEQATLEKSFCLTSLGALYNWLGKGKESIYYCEKALELQSKLFDSGINVQVCESIKWLGSAYGLIDKNELGIEHTEKALSINKEIFGEKINIQRCCILNNLGQLYRKVDKLDLALECHFKVMEMEKKIFSHEFFMPILTLTDIAIDYRLKKNYLKSLSYSKKAMKIAADLYPDYQHPTCLKTLCNMGMTYIELRQTVKAIRYFERVIEKGKKYNYIFETCQGLYGMGKAYIKLGKYDNAATYLSEARAIAQDENSVAHSILPDILDLIQRIDEKMKPSSHSQGL